MQDIFSLDAVLSRVQYQATRDWAPESFQLQHFRHPEESATKIKVLQNWMKQLSFVNILHVLSNLNPIPLVSTTATKMKKESQAHYQDPLFTI